MTVAVTVVRMRSLTAGLTGGYRVGTDGPKMRPLIYGIHDRTWLKATEKEQEKTGSG